MSARCPFMCWAPFSKRQPCHCWHLASRRVRAVEAVREDRLGHDDVDAADRVDQLVEPVEVDDGDVVDVEARQVLDRLQRQRRPTELRGGVELRGPVPGDLDAEVARDREEGEPVLARVGADQHHRVGAMGIAAAGLRAAVGSEDEDRRRGGREEAVLALELGGDGRRDAAVRVLDPPRDREVARDEPDDGENEQDHAARA